MININLHLRDLKAKTPQRIWAVFYYEKKRIKIDTNQFALPKDWSKSKQNYLSSNNYDFAKDNKFLKEKNGVIEEFAEKIIKSLQREKKRFYKDEFQIELQSQFNAHYKIGENIVKKEDDVVDFISFIDKYIANRGDLTEGTLKTHKKTLRHLLFAFDCISSKTLKEWNSASKYERRIIKVEAVKQIEFDEINIEWFEKLNNYLLHTTFTTLKEGVRVTENYTKNYIRNILKTTKHFCIAAENAGKPINLNYKNFFSNKNAKNSKAGKEDSDSVYLEWEEIEKLKALTFSPDSLKGRVRNLFVFNCYCGLRYSDLSRLDANRFATINNQLFLKIRTKKVDEIIHFPILKSAEKIMEIYDYNLPKVVSTKYNIEIKKICLIAGIAGLQEKRQTRGGTKIIYTIPKYKMVASHTARRSFATNFFDDKVPIKELMAVTGHTTEAAFLNYVKSNKPKEFAKFLEIGANR